MSYWMEGDMTRVAGSASIGLTDLSAILHRRRGVSVRKAMKLMDAAAENGYDIPWEAWALNRSTEHPAFFGKVQNDAS